MGEEYIAEGKSSVIDARGVDADVKSSVSDLRDLTTDGFSSVINDGVVTTDGKSSASPLFRNDGLAVSPANESWTNPGDDPLISRHGSFET